MSSVTTYSLSSYGRMIKDRVRTDAYARALQNSIRPGAVVLDIGTGTGIFALLACEFGAGRVYAVEPSDVIEVARQTAIQNGLGERIVFIQDLSTRITLPESVDVVVSNIGGVLPLFEQHIPVIADARRRFLKPGGALIPTQDRLFAAIVEAPDVYLQTVSPWEDRPHGLDLSCARDIVVNYWIKQRVTPEQLLVAPAVCGSIDYRTAESTSFCAALNWRVERAGVAHGISVWFDSTLADGVCFSNAPSAPETIFGDALFPLREPVSLAAGDHVSLQLRATLVENDYVWNWDSQFTAADSETRIAAFEQSTFFADVLSPHRLKKRATGFRPSRNPEAELQFAVLGLMDGASTVQEIAGQLIARFPGRFPTMQEALTYVGQLTETWSR